MHRKPLNLIDLPNEMVQPIRNLPWGSALPLDYHISVPDWANSLSIHTPIPPNIPFPLRVQPLLLPPLSNFFCDQSLMLAIIPFRQVVCDLDIIITMIHINRAIEENFESLGCTLTRGVENAGELGSVKQLSGAYE